MKGAVRERLPGVLLLVALAALWEIAGRLSLVDSFYFPSVGRILTALGSSFAEGRLPRALLASLTTGGLGYGLAAVCGVAIGVLAGRHGSVYRLIEPLIELLRPLPSPAILPLAILLLGIGTSMKVFVVAWACFFPILVNTVDGVRAVPPALVETAQNLGLGHFRIVTSIVIPAAAPAIFTGLRVALSLMLILVVIAEMVAGSSGIGHLILESERSFRVADMYAYIGVLAVVGYLLNRAFLAVDDRLLFWHHRRHRAARR